MVFDEQTHPHNQQQPNKPTLIHPEHQQTNKKHQEYQQASKSKQGRTSQQGKQEQTKNKTQTRNRRKEEERSWVCWTLLFVSLCFACFIVVFLVVHCWFVELSKVSHEGSHPCVRAVLLCGFMSLCAAGSRTNEIPKDGVAESWKPDTWKRDRTWWKDGEESKPKAKASPERRRNAGNNVWIRPDLLGNEVVDLDGPSDADVKVETFVAPADPVKSAKMAPLPPRTKADRPNEKKIMAESVSASLFAAIDALREVVPTIPKAPSVLPVASSAMPPMSAPLGSSVPSLPRVVSNLAVPVRLPEQPAMAMSWSVSPSTAEDANEFLKSATGVLERPTGSLTADSGVVGTLDAMCSEKEIQDRIVSRQLDAFEMARGSVIENPAVNPALATKKYQRSSADKQYLPEDIRTLPACARTLWHLMTRVISADEVKDVEMSELAAQADYWKVYSYLRDRTRAIRVDLNLQKWSMPMRVYIVVHEVCLRFEILSMFILSSRKELLDKCLGSWKKEIRQSPGPR